MPSTAIDRRQALRLLAAGLAVPAGTTAAATGPARNVYLSAAATEPGRYRVCAFSGAGEVLFDHALPARGHAFAVSPDGGQAVHFARRPGEFALALDLERGVAMHWFTPPDDRRLQGHGVFSSDGRLLYATENDFEAGRGAVGIYDAHSGFGRLGELSSHGIGPHDIKLMPDGRTLVVANGGIHTHPDYPRAKLNLPTMEPSLCFIDSRTGDLQQRLVLASDLRLLSIRHLAVGANGQVAVAMQYEGPAGDQVPLVAMRRSASLLQLLETPAPVLAAMKHYCGDVCFDRAGRRFAVTAPRGHLVTLWDGMEGRFLHSMRLTDCCGLAPGTRDGEFLASSGEGGVLVLDQHSGQAFQTGFSEPRHWDNHLAMTRSA